MTKLILKNPGTNKNNQRKKQTHRQQTHTHTNTGTREKHTTQSISIPHSSRNTIPRNGSPQKSHPASVKTFTGDCEGISCALQLFYLYNIRFVRKQHTLQLTKVKAQPWPLAQHSGFTTSNQVQ